MGTLTPGPRFRQQMARLGMVWKQGQHVLTSGVTGSGKTLLNRYVIEERIKRGGYVIVLVGKLGRDSTITNDYKGFTRWTKWRSPGLRDNRVLLWPNTERYKTIADKRKLQKDVFGHAFDKLSNYGDRTVQVDEGLYTCDPEFLNLKSHLAMLHQMGRSSHLSLLTLVQRPAHIPLVLYGSASHVFAGRMREDADRKRLAELGGKESSKEYLQKISAQTLHQYLWIPVAQDWEAETIELTR